MKKQIVSLLIGTLCVSATNGYAGGKKGLHKIGTALISKTLPGVEKQVAQSTLKAHLTPYASAANIPTATAVLSLERVKAEALHPQVDLSKLVSIRPTNHFDLTNRALLNVQKSLQQYGTTIPNCHILPSQGEEKVLLLDFYTLLLKDIRGELSLEEQTQLRYLFWHTNTSVSSVERKLQSWQDRYGDTPTLPDKEIIFALKRNNMWTLEWVQEGWALAADVYMLQKLYGENLPRRIKNTNVIPERYQAKAAFQQQLKKEQEWIENARGNGLFDKYWSKVEVADVVYNDTDKLARMVKAFYFYYIDPSLNVLPRAKYLKTNEAGRIYEIPLKKGLFLEVPGPLNLIPITPEEYVVFKADGEYENPHLIKRADVELLTDPAFYELTK